MITMALGIVTSANITVTVVEQKTIFYCLTVLTSFSYVTFKNIV